MMAESSDHASRQRLRPWLVAQINSGNIPGLCWLDEEKTKFKIPWKHAGKQDWNPSCSQIFMEWAKQTGSYREGIDKPQYVKWKTRLRCALNKAQDFEHLEEESQTQEDHPEQYRVYKLLPRPNDELNGLPSDLTNLDSTELRQLDNAIEPVNVESSLASMSSVTMSSRDLTVTSHDVTMTSYDEKVVNTISAMTLDMEQLTDSMSSVTFDAATLNSDELIGASSQKKPNVAVVFIAAEDHLRDTLPMSGVQNHRGGLAESGQIMFSRADRDDLALSQTPVTFASTLDANFSPATFQRNPAAGVDTGSCAEPAERSAVDDDCSVEEFGCLGLQDMLVNDEF